METLKCTRFSRPMKKHFVIGPIDSGYEVETVRITHGAQRGRSAIVVWGSRTPSPVIARASVAGVSVPMDVVAISL